MSGVNVKLVQSSKSKPRKVNADKAEVEKVEVEKVEVVKTNKRSNVENEPADEHVDDPVDQHDVDVKTNTEQVVVANSHENMRKRVTVLKGQVKLVNVKKSINKRNTRKERASSATTQKSTRGSNRRAHSKSSTRSSKNAKSSAKGKNDKNAPRERRPFNTEPAPIDKSGIGIGPAKVKKVLMHVAFNPVEFNVRKELIKAENKPVRPKPTKENPDPAMPEQGPTVPINKLPKSVLEIVEQAEKVHREALQTEYEHDQLNAMSEDEKLAYKKAKKLAYTEAKKASTDPDNFKFDLRSFNVSYNKKFYANFKSWCAKNDSYLPGKTITDKKGNVKVRFNEWTRAMALVNKSCIRLSGGVRDILACYLDNFVIQYARNGMINCIASKNSNLQLQHALTLSNDFDERVPLDAFARTFDGYQNALNWIEGCRQTKEERDELKARAKREKTEGKVDVKLPAYPDPEYDENFGGYVVDICRSVRNQLASSQKSAEAKNQFYNIKISENFKKFCSIIINEAILRIGAHLKEVITLKDVKTVNENIMYHTLRQVSNICGIPFTPVQTDLKTRLEKFELWCAKRRAERKANKNKAEEDADEEVNEDVEAVTMQTEEDDTDVHNGEDGDNDDVVSGNGDDEELEEEDDVPVEPEDEN
jgi:hypothetical protein